MTSKISPKPPFVLNEWHKCIFVPKFHCEQNPIEMVCTIHSKCMIQLLRKSAERGYTVFHKPNLTNHGGL
ncbi:hypothetical protein BYT27DRAFT_7109401 [Phlegmacium glaucopus]|nr:hypothetical protein BYT27DRAFT_7109401 [Phlegmacium glaucopus]